MTPQFISALSFEMSLRTSPVIKTSSRKLGDESRAHTCHPTKRIPHLNLTDKPLVLHLVLQNFRDEETKGRDR